MHFVFVPKLIDEYLLSHLLWILQSHHLLSVYSSYSEKTSMMECMNHIPFLLRWHSWYMMAMKWSGGKLPGI